MAAANAAAETTATTGLGPYVLGGALPGSVTFASRVANGTVRSYRVTDRRQTEWVSGLFSSASNSLSRITIEASTNGGAPIDWGPGRKFVYLDSDGA